MPAQLPTSRKPIVPSYPTPRRVLAGVGAALLGAAALSGCGIWPEVDEELRKLSELRQADGGWPDAGSPQPEPPDNIQGGFGFSPPDVDDPKP